MGLIKGIFKVAGSVVLTATGLASGIAEGLCSAVGGDDLASLFAQGKDASFNGIKNMWSDSSGSETFNEKIDDFSSGIADSTCDKMADTAKRAAEIAKQHAERAKQQGDQDKYAYFQDKYDYYMEQYYKYKN